MDELRLRHDADLRRQIDGEMNTFADGVTVPEFIGNDCESSGVTKGGSPKRLSTPVNNRRTGAS